MADTFLKIGTSFPQGAFRPDGQPNIPSQAYADYLAANSMTPRADPVGYVPQVRPEEQSYFQNPAKYNQKPFDNYGFNVAGDYIRDAGQSFKNAVTGQGVAQALPEMAFYPGGPTGAQYVYGGLADAGLGAINTLMAGLGAGAGFVAEQMPFQNENQEDSLSRDLLGGFEFTEQYLTPYFGLFTKLGRASKVATAASKAPDPPVAIIPDMPDDTPEFGALAAQQQQAPPLSMEELGARLRAQQPDELTDAEMDDAVADLILDEDLDVVQPPATMGQQDADDILLEQLFPDGDFSEIDEANAAYDRRVNERIDIELANRPELQSPSVRLGVQSLRDSDVSPDEIEKYLAGISDGYKPVYQISEAKNTDQLRELYERYELPIPKTEAEERAADLIIQVATGEPIDQSMRRGIDLDYLKEHATPTVFNQAKPTIQEALEAERQYGVLNDVSVGQETDMGALTGAFGNNSYIPTFSPSMKAAENLPQEKGAYKSLKKWMLKNGAKAKELEWSGADEAFEGRTDVTKTELIQYLNENKDLVEAERKVAQGVLRSEGGDTRMAVENYIDDNLDSEAEMLRENFKDNWEYNNNMESIEDYVASENIVPLEMLIDEIDGIDTVDELIERFPEGYIGDKDRMTGFREVFEDADEASTFDANINAYSFEQDARESLQETLDEMEQYDPELYGRMIFGDAGASADTSELEYTKYFPSGGTNTAETTYQFRDPTGRLPDDYFKETHFEETGRDTNLVAHVRTAEFPVDGGGTAYHVGEIQSDAAQALRDKDKQTGEVTKYTPRTREQEIQMGEYRYLSEQLSDEIKDSEDDLNRIVFGDDVGLGTVFRRDLYPEKLAIYKKIIADFKNKQSGVDINNSRDGQVWRPDQLLNNRTFLGHVRGNMSNYRSELNDFAQYIFTTDNIPSDYVDWANSYAQRVPKIDSLSSGLKRFDNQNFSKAQTGAPFIESTDTWVNMTLKRQLMDAIESGADYITLPNPEMVKKYTYGDLEGHRAFYGEIAPSNLLDIAKSYDPDAQLVGKVIETSSALEAVTALPLTKRLVQAIMDKGISTYAVPLAVGAATGYGALDQVGGQDG